MRKSSTYILAFILAIVFMGCGEEFLDLKPFSSYTTENFYETPDQITSAVNALYPTIRGLHTGAVFTTGDFRSDNTTFQFNANDRGREAAESVDYFLAESNNGINNAYWGPCYSNISRCHFILENIDEVSFADENIKQVRLAETRFVRGYMYFHLTRNYGDVPLIDRVITTEEESAGIRRSPVADIYNQMIIPDLEFAIANLPAKWDDKNQGRVSADAARMALADAYFTMRDYANALPLLEEVVQSGRYTLVSDYKQIFQAVFPANSEMIFTAEHNFDELQGTLFYINWLPQRSGSDITEGEIAVGSLAGRNIPTLDMIDSYEEGDLRREASIGFYDDNGTIVPYISKYLFPPVNGGTDLDVPIYRLADAQLMYAEALLEVQGGLPNQVFEILNSLRIRAGLPLYFPGNPNPDLNLDSPEKLLEAVRKERRVELAFEGKRFYDLTRWGILEEVMLAHGEEQKMLQDFLDPLPNAYTNITELLAIPFDQVLRFGYRQNPGW